MIISRQLRISLLISFFWHLFWMSFVSIIFLPSGFAPRRYSSVHFLGSILRSPASIEQAPITDKEHIAEFPPEADVQKQSYFSKKSYISLPAREELFDPDIFIDIDVSRESAASFANLVPKEEKLIQREIIFQPSFLKYPEWAQQEDKSSYIIFKIYISADGLVEEVINQQASGNPEIDAAFARYVRRWRFAPTSGQQGQWQVVKISLDFE